MTKYQSFDNFFTPSFIAPPFLASRFWASSCCRWRRFSSRSRFFLSTSDSLEAERKNNTNKAFEEFNIKIVRKRIKQPSKSSKGMCNKGKDNKNGFKQNLIVKSKKVNCRPDQVITFKLYKLFKQINSLCLSRILVKNITQMTLG